MEIRKFTENLDISKNRIYKKYDKTIKQYIIDSYNKEGYKLYYYKDFKLIEIENIKKWEDKYASKMWEDHWTEFGDFIFFLNDDEYNKAMNVINSSKKLYDMYIKQAESISKLPLSSIYYDILKQ